MKTLACLILAASATGMAADYPSAEITNGLIRMKLYLPEGDQASYQGTRFDWSGIAYSIQYEGHEFAGRWYPKHDPKIHDAVTGPVEEFLEDDSAHGYEEAKRGGTFVRIGVGIVRRPAGEKAYQRFQTYEIVDGGHRTFRKTRTSAVFVHELAQEGGYAYRYTKTIRLTDGLPQFTIEHVLRNTGRRAITIDTYDHNFFVIDDTTIGPGVSILFPFEPKARQDLHGRAEIKGRSLEYLRDLQPGGEDVATEIDGFGPGDYDFRIENRKAGAGVRIRGDQPLSKIYFWSIRTVACPEPYIHLRVEPDKEIHWMLTYDLYTLSR